MKVSQGLLKKQILPDPIPSDLVSTGPVFALFTSELPLVPPITSGTPITSGSQ